MPLRLFAPGYWPTWIGLGLLRVIAALPYRARVALGRTLGSMLLWLPLNYVRVARCNLEICLPERSPQERREILKEHFRDLGAALCETGFAWWGSDERIRAISQVQGLEHVERALASGRGVILLTAHFTTMEMCGRIASLSLPIHFLYRPVKNEVLGWVLTRNREQRAHRAIERDDIRALVRALKRNECVWYAPDQSYRKKGAMMVPFFGVPAATNVFISRLAAMTGAAVVPLANERLPGAAGYRVVFHPALTEFPGECAATDAERYHRFIEHHTRRLPSQYLWIHRRFKGLTADYPNYYGEAARSNTQSAA